MVNEKFYSLEEEKQKKILNAAIEVFAERDYKHASTEDIAAKAGISKGLLFFYFKNKISLYQYIYEYAMNYVYDLMVADHIWDYTDFFELLEVSMEEKIKISLEYPKIFDFMMRAYFAKEVEVANSLEEKKEELLQRTMNEVMDNVDYSAFRKDVDLEKLLNIIYWTGEGYLRNKIQNNDVDLMAIKSEFGGYLDLLRSMFYESKEGEHV